MTDVVMETEVKVNKHVHFKAFSVMVELATG